jgi:hypothetical protein
MRTDGQTDMTKLIVAFRNFANAPEVSNKGLYFVRTQPAAHNRFEI